MDIDPDDSQAPDANANNDKRPAMLDAEQTSHDEDLAAAAPSQPSEPTSAAAETPVADGQTRRAADDLEITRPMKAHAGATPLAPGQVVGGYRIEREARQESGGPVYWVTLVATADQPEEEAPGVRYALRAAPGGAAADSLAHIVAMNLRHPALLTPVALAREGGRLYLVTMELVDDTGAAPTTMSQGERLRPVDALRAGIELADALATMHRNGLAHLHISPSEVTLYDGRIYLSGVENATIVGGDTEEGRPLFARDANYLARTMGEVGGVAGTERLDEESSALRSLREIAERGAAGKFARADELAESFALALQALASGGAAMGGDLRSVRLRLFAAGATTVGRVRSANQDAYGVAVFDVRDDAAADAPVGVFLVADGMGGEEHGEIASRLVARVVAAEVTRQFSMPVTLWPTRVVAGPNASDSPPTALPLAQALEQAVKEANRQTRAFGRRLNATTGSTVTALAVSGARAAIAHLGDSRAYLLRNGQLLQLTEDHSLLARMEAVNHPLLEDPSFMVPRSVLYRSVGQEDDVTPDLVEFAIAPGDRMVLCSDGLWDELEPEVIGRRLAEAPSPEACARDLVSLANLAGGSDNSTAVAIFVEADPPDSALAMRSEPITDRRQELPDDDVEGGDGEAAQDESDGEASGLPTPEEAAGAGDTGSQVGESEDGSGGVE